jgi:hypothetical protein
MTRQIPESDWKLFRRLRKVALERFCDRTLSELGGLIAATGRSSHERYLAICKLLRERDDELADTFDDSRRSTAYQQLAFVRSLGLLTDEEFVSFSEETREVVDLYLGR